MSDAALQAEWLRQYDTDPLFRYWQANPGNDGGMSPGQEEFHRCPSRLRALVAGNQVGKTRAFAAEVWWHMLGSHPYREVVPAPNIGWIIIPILDEDWPKVCRKLREIEPPGEVDPDCHYDTSKGYSYRGKRGIRLKNGSHADPKSGTQAMIALEGDTLAWIGFDEPPKETHWTGPLTRISVGLGDAWLTFTPVGRPLGWLWSYWEGNPDTGEAGHPEWAIQRLILSAENCPHRTVESIEAQIATYSSWEIGQRVYAEREGVTVGRRLKSFSEACIIDDAELPASLDALRLGLDHGEGIGKQIGYLTGVVGTRYTLLREILPRDALGRTCGDNPTARDVARGILFQLASLGLTIHHISAAFGDANSAGLLGGGGKYNAFIEQALADELGLTNCPIEIRIPNKRAGSVKAGEAAINTACREGRWHVHESCAAWIHAARHYTGREADLKDPIDAGRYSVADLLLAPTLGGRGGPGPALIVL
jgi:hypothetical protein